MKFVGKVWKLLVGVKDALVLLFMLLFFAVLYGAMAGRPTVGAGEKGALLLDIAGPIVEQPTETSPTQALAGRAGPTQYRLRDVVAALHAAATDSRVQAVALDLDIFSGGGQTTLSDVGAALDSVKKAGKPVLAYATAYDDDSYFLAAHASEVWLSPMGGVLIAGPGGTGLYFKGLLDKLGVTANVYRVGTYKAAVEPFIRNDMSPEARQASQALAGSLWEDWQQQVARARPRAQVAAYAADTAARIAGAGGNMAKAAMAAGLVDHVGDREAFGARVAKITGARYGSVPGSFRTIDYDAWVEANPAGEDGGEIGIVTVAGDIVDGDAGLGTAGAETIVRALETGLRERNLKALVLRVDSPGGSALASERIRKAVLAAKARGLPVVVSMGSVAASGGYWVSTAGDRIFAEPSTITGSIGVFGIVPSFQGSLAKLGIGADGVQTTPLSGEPNVLRGPSPAANQLLQAGVEGTYRRFLTLVSDARKLPVARVDQIAQGRVWDGGTARQLGLVDSFGGLDDAIAEAARRAKLDPGKAKAVWLEKAPSLSDRLVMALVGEGDDRDDDARDSFTRIAAKPRLALLQALADADRLLGGAAIQARCLECRTVAAAPPRVARRGLAAWLIGLLG
ncbi:MAG: signal peptide peptidase SppA [Alphaproteobacteria bacterium]|nr:signal peptide peptidase SppA [Alphaproteobacteria bacterium]MBV9373273.1 signal peptide peptidase SppA [Alphaproteobacteria bacterium]MBV9900346.1 signal peptide peptidase SppA [Alphaproteobacteria bacterium]